MLKHWAIVIRPSGTMVWRETENFRKALEPSWCAKQDHEGAVASDELLISGSLFGDFDY
jgi:hypothetical protein